MQTGLRFGVLTVKLNGEINSVEQSQYKEANGSASAKSAFPSSVCSGHSGSPSLGVFRYSSSANSAESGMSAAKSSAVSFR
jgi:hypothetical protein